MRLSSGLAALTVPLWELEKDTCWTPTVGRCRLLSKGMASRRQYSAKKKKCHGGGRWGEVCVWRTQPCKCQCLLSKAWAWLQPPPTPSPSGGLCSPSDTQTHAAALTLPCGWKLMLSLKSVWESRRQDIQFDFTLVILKFKRREKLTELFSIWGTKQNLCTKS